MGEEENSGDEHTWLDERNTLEALAELDEGGEGGVTPGLSLA